MRVTRFIYGLMAFLPLITLSAIGWRGRAPWPEPQTAVDPPGFSKRLEAYADFVRSSKKLRRCKGSYLAPANLAALHDTLNRVNPAMPGVEAPSNETSKVDVRQPITVAEELTFRRGRATLDAYIALQKFDQAARLLPPLYRLCLSTRCFDFPTFVTTSVQLSQLITRMRMVVPRLSVEQRKWLVEQIELERETRESSTDIMRNDLRLLSLELITGTSGDVSDPGVPAVASQAFQIVKNGGLLDRYLQRVSTWPRSPQRDRLWSVLASWQIIIKKENSEKRALESALQTKFKDDDSSNWRLTSRFSLNMN